MAATGETCFALVLDRSAYLVTACQAVNLGAMFGQPCQKVRKILHLLGNDVDDATFFLHEAGDRYTPPRGASDAVLAPYHIERAKIYARQRFASSKFINEERIVEASR